jgi:AAA15 family ATPase/GTPase
MENFKELEEVEIKNAVEPQVFQYKCDDKIENIPYPLPDSIFRMACIGRSGSGKSNLIQALTQSTGKKRIYNKKFSNVFIVSPSVGSQANRPKLPSDRFYTSVKDLDEIFDRIINEEGMEGRTLIILDDLGSELKKSGEETIILKKLFNNGRHIGRPIIEEETGEQLESGAVSVMISAQKLTQLPPYLRHQLTHLAIFDPRNTKTELQTLYDEFFSCEKDIFNSILSKVFSKPYNFIFVDCRNCEIFNGFKSRFKINRKVYL